MITQLTNLDLVPRRRALRHALWQGPALLLSEILYTKELPCWD